MLTAIYCLLYFTLRYFIIITFTLPYITARQSKNLLIPKNGVDHTIHCSKTSVHDGIDVHCNRTQHLTSSSSAQISSLKSSSHQCLQCYWRNWHVYCTM